VGNISLTSGQRIAQLFVIWILGLGMLGPPGDSLARPKRFDPAKIYCQCTCHGSGGVGHKDLVWEKVAHCSLNGRSCSFNDPYTGQKTPGKLDGCSECKATESRLGLDCTAVAAGPRGDVGLEEPAVAPPDSELKTPAPRGDLGLEQPPVAPGEDGQQAPVAPADGGLRAPMGPGKRAP
jgi:hypothetical protein